MRTIKMFIPLIALLIAISFLVHAPAWAGQQSAESCDSYNSCMASGLEALKYSVMDHALARFQKAAQLDPSRGDPWAGIGTAYLQMGQYDDAASMWDKALQLGATLAANVCHAGIMCGDTGTLLMSTKEISFVNAKGQKEFAVAPSELTSEPAGYISPRPAYYLQIHFGKNWRFYYHPNGMQCSLNFECPDPGPDQQRVFANYVHDTLVKLETGEFNADAQQRARAAAAPAGQQGAEAPPPPIPPRHRLRTNRQRLRRRFLWDRLRTKS